MTKTRTELIRELFDAVINNDVARIEEFRGRKDLINSRYEETGYLDVLDTQAKLTPLMVAVQNDSNGSEAAKLLIDLGAHVNVKASHGCTPLHGAAIKGRANIVKALLDAGADKDARNNEGNSPLHYAAALGKNDVIKVLIYADANKDVKDIDGNTPLHIAASENKIKTLKVLALFGADIFAKNKDGKTPLDYIEDHSIKDEMVKLHNIYNKVAGKQILETRKVARKIANNVRVLNQKTSIGNKEKLESHSSLAILPKDILGDITSYLGDDSLTPDAVKDILKACQDFQNESASLDDYLNNYPETIFDFVTQVKDYLAHKFPYIAKTMQAKTYEKHIDNIEKISTEGSQKNHTDQIIRERIAQVVNGSALPDM